MKREANEWKVPLSENNEITLGEQGALPISKIVFANVAYYISLMKILPNIHENGKGCDLKLCFA